MEEALSTMVPLHNDAKVKKLLSGRNLVIAIGMLHVRTRPTTIAQDFAILIFCSCSFLFVRSSCIRASVIRSSVSCISAKTQLSLNGDEYSSVDV